MADIKNIIGVSEQSEVTKLQPVDQEQEETHAVENMEDMVG